jgi:hypothetical protein
MNMRNISLNLNLSIPESSTVMDVTALLAAFRFVLKGFFPDARLTSDLPLPKGKSKSDPHPTTLM